MGDRGAPANSNNDCFGTAGGGQPTRLYQKALLTTAIANSTVSTMQAIPVLANVASTKRSSRRRIIVQSSDGASLEDEGKHHLRIPHCCIAIIR